MSHPPLKIHAKTQYFGQRQHAYIRINRIGQVHLSAGLVAALGLQRGDTVALADDASGNYFICRTAAGFELKQNRTAGAALHFNCRAIVRKLQDHYKLSSQALSHQLHVDTTPRDPQESPLFYPITKSRRQ